MRHPALVAALAFLLLTADSHMPAAQLSNDPTLEGEMFASENDENVGFASSLASKLMADEDQIDDRNEDISHEAREQMKWTPEEKYAYMATTYRSPLDAPTSDLGSIENAKFSAMAQKGLEDVGLLNPGEVSADALGEMPDVAKNRETVEGEVYSRAQNLVRESMSTTQGAMHKALEIAKVRPPDLDTKTLEDQLGLDEIGTAATVAAYKGAQTFNDEKLMQDAGKIKDPLTGQPIPSQDDMAQRADQLAKQLLPGGLPISAQQLLQPNNLTSSQLKMLSDGARALGAKLGIDNTTADGLLSVGLGRADEQTMVQMTERTEQAPPESPLGQLMQNYASSAAATATSSTMRSRNAMMGVARGFLYILVFFVATTVPAILRGFMKGAGLIPSTFNYAPMLSHDVPSPHQLIETTPKKGYTDQYYAAMATAKDIPLWWSHSGAHVPPPWWQSNAPPNRPHLGRASVNVPSPPFLDSPYRSPILDYWTGKRPRGIPPTPKQWPTHHMMAGAPGDGSMRCPCPHAPMLLCDCQAIEYDGSQYWRMPPTVEEKLDPGYPIKNMVLQPLQKTLGKFMKTPYPEMALMATIL